MIESPCTNCVRGLVKLTGAVCTECGGKGVRTYELVGKPIAEVAETKKEVLKTKKK